MPDLSRVLYSETEWLPYWATLKGALRFTDISDLIALAFIAYIPFSPLIHLILVPINAGLAVPVAGPKMGVMDFSAFPMSHCGFPIVLGVYYRNFHASLEDLSSV